MSYILSPNRENRQLLQLLDINQNWKPAFARKSWGQQQAKQIYGDESMLKPMYNSNF